MFVIFSVMKCGTMGGMFSHEVRDHGWDVLSHDEVRDHGWDVLS